MVLVFVLCLSSYKFLLKGDPFVTTLLKKSEEEISTQKLIITPIKLDEVILDNKNNYEVNDTKNFNMPFNQSEILKPVLTEGAIPLETMIEEFRKRSLQNLEESRKSPFEK